MGQHGWTPKGISLSEISQKTNTKPSHMWNVKTDCPSWGADVGETGERDQTV